MNIRYMPLASFARIHKRAIKDVEDAVYWHVPGRWTDGSVFLMPYTAVCDLCQEQPRKLKSIPAFVRIH